MSNVWTVDKAVDELKRRERQIERLLDAWVQREKYTRGMGDRPVDLVDCTEELRGVFLEWRQS